MSQDKQPLKQALKNHYFNWSLTDEQVQQLQLKLDANAESEINTNETKEQPIFSRSKYLWLSSMAASLMIFFILFGKPQSPELVTYAYSDIKKDAIFHNGLDKTISEWLGVKNIPPFPKGFNIEMSKFCQLKQHPATHIRVAGITQGTAHFFFHQTNSDLTPKMSRGFENDMNWRVIKLHEDLSVLVIYSQDMREQAIQHILDGMLPEINV